MVARVRKLGNSQGLRLSKEVLEQARIAVGDEVKVSVRGGRIIVEPVTKVRGRYRLKDLVAKIPKGHEAEEIEWESAVGREVW